MSSLLSVLFIAGLITRLVRWLRGDGARARGRGGSARRQEWAARSFAYDVPPPRLRQRRTTPPPAPRD